MDTYLASAADMLTGQACLAKTVMTGRLPSQHFRKRIEECFGWTKTVGGLRKSGFLGRKKLDFQSVLTMAAYNLVRMRNLRVVSC